MLTFGAGQQTNRRRQDLKGTYVKQKALACFGQGAGIWGRLAERGRTRPWGPGPPGRRRPEEKKGVRAGAEGSRPPPHRPRSRPLTTYHLDNLGLPARLLLHGEDVLGQHHPADQCAHASAGHRAHLRHGGPVHGSSQGHGKAPRAAAGKRPLTAEGGRAEGGWGRRGPTSAPARADPQRPPDPATTAPRAARPRRTRPAARAPARAPGETSRARSLSAVPRRRKSGGEKGGWVGGGGRRSGRPQGQEVSVRALKRKSTSREVCLFFFFPPQETGRNDSLPPPHRKK